MYDGNLNAIDASILKWKNIYIGKTADHSYRNCSLCTLYNKFICTKTSAYNTQCEGCPIKEQTGKPYCESTPYEQWLKHAGKCNRELKNYNFRNGYRVVCHECEKLALKEIEYLQALRKLYLRKIKNR